MRRKKIRFEEQTTEKDIVSKMKIRLPISGKT